MFYSLYNWIAQIPPKIWWRKKRLLTEDKKKELAKKFASGYYVILTGDRGHLSSLIICILQFLKLGKWSRYSHVLINCDFLDKEEEKNEFKFIEATAVGVHYSTFEEVFYCDYVCLLTPKNITNEKWTKVIDSAVKNNGVPYDDLFDLSDSTKISCVELVLNAFKTLDKYSTEFADLEKMIAEERNLMPQMYKDCPDFEVAYETS